MDLHLVQTLPWPLFMAAALGLLLGLLFKVPALIVASIAATACWLPALAYGRSSLAVIIDLAMTLTGLQGAYLVGLAVRFTVDFWRRSGNQL
jgi:hypothetical protein